MVIDGGQITTKVWHVVTVCLSGWEKKILEKGVLSNRRGSQQKVAKERELEWNHDFIVRYCNTARESPERKSHGWTNVSFLHNTGATFLCCREKLNWMQFFFGLFSWPELYIYIYRTRMMYLFIYLFANTTTVQNNSALSNNEASKIVLHKSFFVCFLNVSTT